MYANDSPISDPDVLIYALCSRFGCLPSELETEDVSMMTRLTYIDYIVQSTLKGRVR